MDVIQKTGASIPDVVRICVDPCEDIEQKIEGLPDDRPSQVACLSKLSRSFGSTGNDVECKQLIHALKLSRERGDDHWVADILGNLSDVN